MSLLQLGIFSSAALQGLHENQGLIQVDVVPLLKDFLTELSGLQSPEQLGQKHVVGVANLLVTTSLGACHFQAEPISHQLQLGCILPQSLYVVLSHGIQLNPFRQLIEITYHGLPDLFYQCINVILLLEAPVAQTHKCLTGETLLQVNDSSMATQPHLL